MITVNNKRIFNKGFALLISIFIVFLLGFLYMESETDKQSYNPSSINSEPLETSFQNIVFGDNPSKDDNRADTIVRVMPENTTIESGSSFSIGIFCEPGQFIKSFELDVRYDPSFIHATTVTEGNIFNGYSTMFNDGSIDNINGEINLIYGLILGSGNVSDSGHLIFINFTAQQTIGDSFIDLLNVGVTNESTYVPLYIVNGSITVFGNLPPILSQETPQNNSQNIPINQNTIQININDPENQPINWTIHGQYIQNNSQNNDNNGIKTATLNTPLPYNTTINWHVNATDGNTWTNQTYTFTTRDIYIPQPPYNLIATPINSTTLQLTWDATTYTDNTIIEQNNQSTWTQGTGSQIYNGTATNTIVTGLDPNTTYYYQAWAYNNTDNTYSQTYSQTNTTIPSNLPITLSQETPSNNSQNIPINQNTIQININDPENQPINWTIHGQYIQNNSQNNDNNGIKTATLNTPLPYNTTISWNVNSNDGNIWTNQTYYFTTSSSSSSNDTNIPPSFSGLSPSNNAIDIQISIGSLNVFIEDSDGDSFNWSIETSPNLGNASSTSDSDGLKTCYISGLNYSTTYRWFVNATDGVDWSREEFSFTTISESDPITFTDVNPSDGSSNIGLFPPCTLNVSHQQSHLMNIQFFENTAGSWVLQDSQSNINSGNIVVWDNYSNVSDYSTEYWWKVIVSDDYGNIKEQVFSFSTVSSPSTLFVNPGFNDSTSGWQLNRFNQIADAVDKASNGATIIIEDGFYYEYIVIDKSISLLAAENNYPCLKRVDDYDFVLLIKSDNVEIDGLSVEGIHIDDVKDCNIKNNKIINVDYGILIDESENINIYNNIIENNSIGLLFLRSTLNSISECFLFNNSEAVRFTDSEDNNLMFNNIHNNSKGVLLEISTDNTLDNNEIYNNGNGVYLVHSNGNNIVNNDILSNSNGIYLRESSINEMANNYISLNSEKGIYLKYSDENIFRTNFIENNSYGFYLFSSENNLIYNNYFDNDVNAWDDGSNSWSKTPIDTGINIIGGSLISGNYWSDYAGIDIDGDGLGDVFLPYASSNLIMDGGDYYPLSTPHINSAPNRPNMPIGPSNGETDHSYEYLCTSTDLDGDKIYYQWTFKDGVSSDWYGPYDSGETCSVRLSWSNSGDYSIKVKAKDEFGAETEWSDSLSVSMPKTKELDFIFNCFEWIYNNIPILRNIMIFLNSLNLS